MSAARVIPFDVTPASPSAAPVPAAPQLAIGHLRAFVTLLVLAHHAVLAYHPFAPAARASLLAEPRWWGAFPIVDPARSLVFALFTGWNEGFFMALMFLLSGLFVSRSLARKGARAFLHDRAVRLGVPFVVGGLILAPLAYYPAYITASSYAGFGGFVREWLALGSWTVGPLWFVWVLLAFGAVAVLLQKVRPGWDIAVAARLSGALARPGRAFGLLVALSVVAYVPMVLAYGPMDWAVLGPFAIQTSRVFLYLLYFLTGVVVGAHGLERGVLATGGTLGRRWWAWAGAALIAYVASLVAAIAAFAPGAGRPVQMASAVAYAVSCAASSFALTAFFLRFVSKGTAVWESLRENAFGMYVVHYAFVSWLQLALLPASFPALLKGTIVTVATVLLSWGTTIALRRVPAVRRVL